MHPDLARALMNQRSREMMMEARDASLARTLRAIRRGRYQATEVIAVPAIPDTVAELIGGEVPPQRSATTR